jgi:hypothetical protein
MSNKVKLTTALPGGEEWNGLDHYADDIRADHTLMLGCWIVFDVPGAEINYDKATTTPKLRVRQVEVLTTDGSVPEFLRGELEKAFTERTGKAMLPLDEADGGPVDEGADSEQQ